jgi:hypothetical protein
LCAFVRTLTIMKAHGRFKNDKMRQQALYESPLAKLPAVRLVDILINFLWRCLVDEAKKAALVDNIARLPGVFRDR